MIAYVLAPELFGTEKARVFVEYDSELCLGQTVADWYGKSGQTANVDIVTRVDTAKVFTLFYELLSRYAGN